MLGKEDGSFEVHFATRDLNMKNKWEQNWHFIHFKHDWVKAVKQYGRVPYDSVTAPLKVFKELQEIKSGAFVKQKEETIAKLTEEFNELSGKDIDQIMAE